MVTLFSAPNYCDILQNKGAYIRIANQAMNIQQFRYEKHPYVLPGNMDAINWSIPLIIEKVLAMMEVVLVQGFELDAAHDSITDSNAYNNLVRAQSLTKLDTSTGSARTDTDQAELMIKLREWRQTVSRVKRKAAQKLSDLDQEGFSPDVHVSKELVRLSQSNRGNEAFSDEVIQSFNEKFPHSQVTT